MSEGEATAWLPSPGIATVLCNTSLGLPARGAALESPLRGTSCFQSRPSEQRGAVQVVVLPGLRAALPAPALQCLRSWTQRAWAAATITATQRPVRACLVSAVRPALRFLLPLIL